MKLLFAAEDTIIGIVCGLLLVGLTERIFSLKLNNTAYVIAFAVYVFFILLDIFNVGNVAWLILYPFLD